MDKLPDLERIEERVRKIQGLSVTLCRGCKSNRQVYATGLLYLPELQPLQLCAVWTDSPISGDPRTIDYLFTEDYLISVAFESIARCRQWLSFKMTSCEPLDELDLG